VSRIQTLYREEVYGGGAMKIPNHIEEKEENEVEFGHYHLFGEKSCQEN
jgi:hypothetical protein